MTVTGPMAVEGARREPAERIRTGPRYAARFLGPFEVYRDGLPFARDALARSASRTLLKWFLVHPGTPIAAAEVGELLWPERPVGARAGRLHATLHQLRRALEPDATSRSDSRFVRSDRKGLYWFDLAGCWDTDLLRTRELLSRARECDQAGDKAGATVALERFVDLSAGGFLPEDLYGDHFHEVRAAHEVGHARAQEWLLQLYMAQGLCHRALSFALSMQHADPYNEDAAVTIAQVHLANGNQAAAAHQLEDFLRLVTRELGAAPGPRLLHLRDRIRAGSEGQLPGGRALPHPRVVPGLPPAAGAAVLAPPAQRHPHTTSIAPSVS